MNEPIINTELYEILGVSANASTEEISRAYKKLALKYHPDKCKDPVSTEQFHKINHANEILSDPKKREMYDKYGTANPDFDDMGGFDFFSKFFRPGCHSPFFDPGFNGPNGPHESHGPHGHRGPCGSHGSHGPHEFHGPHESHRSHGPHEYHGSHGPHRHKLTEEFVREITLEELFSSQDKITVSYPRKIKCDTCGATGFKDKQVHLCARCKGSGNVMRHIKQGYTSVYTQTQCDACFGKGKDTGATATTFGCKNCGGAGTIEITHTTDIEISPDFLKNNCVMLENLGSWHDETKPRATQTARRERNGVGFGVTEGTYADMIIILKLNVKLTPNFDLTADKKLIYTMHINFPETLCGFVRLINHPSGKKICIKSEPGTIINPLNIYILENLGFIKKNMIRTPLYLTFVIHYPEKVEIPNNKKLAFTYRNLEKILGGKLELDHTIKNDLDMEIYSLHELKKIDNNININDMSDSDSEQDVDPHSRHFGPNPFMYEDGCSQQ